jgi:sterol 3beta-glucosyltransferase
MRIVLTNFGTTGDVQPFLALGVELLRQSHEAVLAFSPEHASRIRQLGLIFYPVEPYLQHAQQKVNSALIERAELYNNFNELHRLFAPLAAGLPQALDQLREACRDADVLISGPAQPVGRMLHEMTGIPFVSVQFSHFGGIGSPALQQASASVINPFRAELGLPPLRDPLTMDANSPQLALYAMSRHICPPQIDWPSHYYMTGYFFLDDKRWEPDRQLIEFIEAGENPVVITFGSMGLAHRDPDASIKLIVDAVHQSGHRAILQIGGSDSPSRTVTPDLYSIGYVPHSWLFPRAACIVHHGGAGTTGAVFRSGAPSVFVPHGYIFDQHYWAQLAEEAGCAGAAIPFAALTAEKLSSAIRMTLATPRYHEAAAALGEKIRSEDGVRTARELIEQMVYKVGLQQDNGRLVKQGSYPESRETKTIRRREYQKRQRSKPKREVGQQDPDAGSRQHVDTASQQD